MEAQRQGGVERGGEIGELGGQAQAVGGAGGDAEAGVGAGAAARRYGEGERWFSAAPSGVAAKGLWPTWHSARSPKRASLAGATNGMSGSGGRCAVTRSQLPGAAPAGRRRQKPCWRTSMTRIATTAAHRSTASTHTIHPDAGLAGLADSGPREVRSIRNQSSIRHFSTFPARPFLFRPG